MVQQIKNRLDNIFGPPGEALKNVKELSDSLANIDVAKLKELRATFSVMSGVQVSGEELHMVVDLARILCNVDLEKVKEFRQLVINLTQLVKLLPKDVPVGDIIQAVKGELGR